MMKLYLIVNVGCKKIRKRHHHNSPHKETMAEGKNSTPEKQEETSVETREGNSLGRHQLYNRKSAEVILIYFKRAFGVSSAEVVRKLCYIDICSFQ